jgi:hypothetical protein
MRTTETIFDEQKRLEEDLLLDKQRFIIMFTPRGHRLCIATFECVLLVPTCDFMDKVTTIAGGGAGLPTSGKRNRIFTAGLPRHHLQGNSQKNGQVDPNG